MTRLVPTATPLVSAIDAATAARLALPVDGITDFWSPERCPVDRLGFLAWQLSIDLWDDSWSELKKRQVCADAFQLHRQKTTLAGIKAHVALVGSTVTRAIRPPARGFLRGAMTDELRAAWLDSLPQLRQYPFLHTATAVRRSFYRSPARAIVGASFDSVAWDFSSDQPGFDVAGVQTGIWTPRAIGVRPLGAREVHRSSRGPELTGHRVTWFDRGAERDVGFDRLDDGSLRAFVPRVSKRGFHGAGFLGAGYLTASAADASVFTVRLSDDAAGYAIGAGLDPVDVRPVRVFQERIAPAARSFFGGRARARFLLASHAPFLIYDKVSIHAPDRLGARRRTRSFHGRGRFGIAAFTAELRIDVPMQRSTRRSGRFHGTGFRAAADYSALDRTIEAVRVSKAQRDTVLIDTTTRRRARFAPGMRFGDFTFGEIREVA